LNTYIKVKSWEDLTEVGYIDDEEFIHFEDGFVFFPSMKYLCNKIFLVKIDIDGWIKINDSEDHVPWELNSDMYDIIAK